MDAPPISPPSYIWPIVVIVLSAVALILGILYFRPQVDPFSLLTAVGGLATIVSGLALNFLKMHEAVLQGRATDKKVDGAMHELMDARDKGSRAEGAIEATATEQARVAEQKLAAAAVGDRRAVPAMSAPVAPAAPVPVAIVSPKPIPVVVQDKKA